MDQEALFDTENPLLERLGKDFFDSIPKCPGVYRMYSGESRLLYVGKAKNLRRRLFTYKNVKRGNGSRKTIRLVRMTHAIEYEECESEVEALTKENRLIRTEKPPFNRAKKSPEAYYYISVIPGNSSLEFNVRMHLREDEHPHTFGAFKGHNLVRRAMGGLLRQLYIHQNGITSPFDLPVRLLNNLTPLHYCLQGMTTTTRESVNLFFSGRSDGILYDFVAQAQKMDLLGKFIGKLFLRDMEYMKYFYMRGPRRNFAMTRKFELDSRIIPQEKLDDYLVRLAFLDS